MPPRKGALGVTKTSENSYPMDHHLSEENNSQKTDSGSSLAEDKISACSGVKAQNFSYSNFHSFGNNSPQHSENYPPRLHHQSSVLSHQVLSQFDHQQQAFQLHPT